MRTFREVEQDRYINNLAQQAMGKNRATSDDFEVSNDSLSFASVVHNRIYVWVSGTLTNSATLRKVVEGAIGDRENRLSRYGDDVQRITPLSRVAGPHFKMGEPGSEILVELATLVLIAAIWDHYCVDRIARYHSI